MIGWLSFRPIIEASSGTTRFQRELRALGYVVGSNIAIEYRSPMVGLIDTHH